MADRREWWVELCIVGAFLAVAMVLSAVFHVPFVAPDFASASFVGVHYLAPLIGLLGAGLLAMRGAGRVDGGVFISIPAYAIVLWLHFNLKLWVPLINPADHDAALWATDQAMRPLVDAAMGVRAWLATWAWGIDRLYMNGFILLFYASFIIHAIRTPAAFRTLMRAALLFQSFGAVAYLACPAIGPFIYETGVNPLATQAQVYMLDVHRQIVGGGAPWLADNGSRVFLAPLAAMPSLHAGGSALFLYFAWRHCRWLLPLYVPLFAFILIGAVANRFHYIVDLPVGIALAAAAIAAAERLGRPRRLRQTGVSSIGVFTREAQLQPLGVGGDVQLGGVEIDRALRA